MNSKYTDLLKSKMSDASFAKLTALENEKVMDFVGQFAEHCNPSSLYVCDDSKEDEQYLRDQALALGEEFTLARDKQTIHWDSASDQARDKVNTRYLVYKENLERMKSLNSIEFNQGMEEIMGIAKGIMTGKSAVVKFYCEGPAFSKFTMPCVQITDSWYVAHSESILYRAAYAHFMAMKNEVKDEFFRFIHSAGELDARNTSINLKDRRIYMDTQNNIVYSMNCQYAGNTIGLKKHSMRLAINKGGQEGWLCEHMFTMGCINEEKGRSTYFAGAFPSACGKTSTAMIPGEKIVGDDIAYFRNIDGQFRAVNVEQGIFGIIKDVNEQDDPLIFENLNINQEVIFSNVLRGEDNLPYWLGSGIETPKKGDNFSGNDWFAGKKDAKGNEIKCAHGNARYTMRLDYLDNFDKAGFEDKNGILIEGVLYGGRDSDTTVPVEESASWKEGILLKACTLESETTSATLGAEGVRTPSPMANMDFLSYPLGEYTLNNINFVKDLKVVPKVFSTNYFLRNEEGNFCNSKLAKKVWLHWAEGRIHGEFEALDTPTGKIPLFADLKVLFKQFLGTDYTEVEYNYQFTFRCDSWVAKLNRSKAYFKKMDALCPSLVFEEWNSFIANIEAAKAKFGNEILPGKFVK
jgi:phosphoenolpyruvate carboxykinase (GTP)